MTPTVGTTFTGRWLYARGSRENQPIVLYVSAIRNGWVHCRWAEDEEGNDVRSEKVGGFKIAVADWSSRVDAVQP